MKIHLKNNLWNKLTEDIKGRNAIVITDDNVAALYGGKLDCPVLSFPAGEENKTRETVARLQDDMLERGFGRDTLVVALGGGVVSDLAGFLASTYMRGVPYIIYSTTMLSAFDACIGGKTAVNTKYSTNTIGSFYLPEAVFVDPACWSTLPDREKRNGFAECVKHGVIASSDLLKGIEDDAFSDIELCEKNIEIKQSFVSDDFRDTKNKRIALNFGHTFGRALETVSDYKLSHGEAVSIGMCLALKLGSTPEYERIESLLKKKKLPTSLPDYIEIDSLIKTLYTDKKVESGKINFVLSKELGTMPYIKSYDEMTLENFLLRERA